MNEFSLAGRVAIVTGAAGLLGQRHCHALANAGAVVYACDNHAAASQALAEQLGPAHAGAFVDVTDGESITELRDTVISEHGRIDILVNNAAINDAVESPISQASHSAFENYPVALFRKVMDVNVTGSFLMSQIIGSSMAQSGKGAIINVASTYGVVAPDQRLYQNENGVQQMYKSAAYPASKGAVIMLTKFMATYWAGQGVRVNTLSPGGVQNNQPDVFIEKYSQRTPMGRMAAPGDYEGALVFLASDASAYMTGHNLIVDGGWTAW
ncbi:MAG: SDR family oxidoreductase [Ignavibacteria bacterium]|jgi:NAD(P)-dependent dehydrogenase (short-subunit alcohol dehydrogenase family)